MKKQLQLILILSLLLISCKKDEGNGPQTLQRKWVLIQMYDGYVNGGNFKWANVSMEGAHRLEFSANGNYVLQEGANGAFKNCTGTFQLSSDNILQINSNCNTVTVTWKVSELTKRTLILDKQVREGIIRYKYSAVN